jgi:transcriptional accessory protein Tex/SPT6
MDVKQRITARLAEELSVRPEQVAATVELLDGGATVPFIARYRKEVTGACATCASLKSVVKRYWPPSMSRVS